MFLAVNGTENDCEFRTISKLKLPATFRVETIISHDDSQPIHFISALLHLVNGHMIKKTISELSVNGLAAHDTFLIIL